MQDRTQPQAQFLEELKQVRRQLAAVQERLEESERRAALLFRTAPLAIHECDVEGRITAVNAVQERMSGYTAEEMLGTFIWDHLEPGPEKDALPAYLKHLASEQPAPTPYFERQVRKDGEVLQVRVDWNYKRDGQGRVVGFVCMVTDITEERKAHGELEDKVADRTAELCKANEELAIFRRFAEAAGQGFGMADMDGLITYMNPALCQMARVERPEDAVGKHLTAYYPEGYQQRRETEIIPALLREGRWEGEIAHILGGRPITVLQHSFLIRDEHGSPSHLASVITDITERKRAEALLQNEYRTLQHLLQSSDHERQVIAYEIHDGLTQHLTAAIMQFQAFEQMKETMPKRAAKAYDAGMTMLRQSHYEARRLIAGVRPPILDELGIVPAISHLVHEQTHGKGSKIEFRSRVGFGRLVPSLENAIYRIVQEALENACQYSDSAKVRVSLVQRDAQVRIRIQDWGIGFDVEAPGEGRFGLEGIRQRTRLWDGTCNIRSVLGEGTRVTVDLPVVERDADETNDE